MKRLFWSPEQQARDEARWRRKEVWLHPAAWWVVRVGLIAGSLVLGTTAGDHLPVWKIFAASLLGVSLVVSVVNDQVVRARRRHGWEPVEGIHSAPDRRPGEGPIALRWRWTFNRQAQREPTNAPGTGRDS